MTTDTVKRIEVETVEEITYKQDLIIKQNESFIKDLIGNITAELIDKTLTGLEPDLRLVKKEHNSKILPIALHCVLNGPVGINKATNFGKTIKDFKIKDLFDDKAQITNSSWFKICEKFAKLIKSDDKIYNLCKKCNQFIQFRDIWPLNQEERIKGKKK